MRKNELLKWTFANAFGLAIAFVVSLQTVMVLDYGLDTERYWKFGQPIDYSSVSTYIYTLISALVGGVIFGWCQSLVIKTRGIKPVSWILPTVIGFALIVLIDWPLLYTENLGIIPGPVEPLIFTVGGGIFAGTLQYFLLRRLGVIAKKWYLLWIVGLLLGLVPTALVLIFIADPIGISWPVETFISGFLIAGVAALVSGKALFSVLTRQNQIFH